MYLFRWSRGSKGFGRAHLSSPICFRETRSLHPGAVFGPGCSESVRNEALTVRRVTSHFDTKSSSTQQIPFQDCGSSRLCGVAACAIPARRCVCSWRMGGRRSSSRSSARGSMAGATLRLISRSDEEDSLVLISAANADTQHLPARAAVVGGDQLEDYFGPFALRAFLYSLPPRVNLNEAVDE